MTSREHVPAACFFPEAKDLPGGRDLRRNLFTVPSCDAHNSCKSKDDQYLWHVIAATQGINECGQQLVRAKLLRSMSERPALANSLMRTATLAHFYDPETGAWHETAKVQFNGDRIFPVLEKFGRALYFLHFKSKWLGVVATFPNFTHFGSRSSADREFQSLWRRVVGNAAEAMAPLKRAGENQEAFYYQVMPPDGSPGTIMRATFYGSAAVTFGFLQVTAHRESGEAGDDGA